MVVFTGLNFGAKDASGTASLELSVACSSSSWTSATTVACSAATYFGGGSATVVIVSLQVGTFLGAFSFDGIPIVLALDAPCRPSDF